MNLPPDDCIECLRGIKDDLNYDGAGFDHSEFSSDFHPLDREELAGWEGTSIYWDLREGGALEQLLLQIDERRNGEIKFKFGAIRIAREQLDDYVRRHKDKFAYEIFPENGNEYHGHILLRNNLEKKRRQTICSLLANQFIFIHRRENHES